MSGDGGAWNERDELAELFRSEALWDSAGILPAYACADVILAAGYRKPRTITTQAELDVLPLRVAVCDAEDYVLAHEIQGLWFIPGDRDPYTVNLPATVIWEPTS